MRPALVLAIFFALALAAVAAAAVYPALRAGLGAAGRLSRDDL